MKKGIIKVFSLTMASALALSAFSMNAMATSSSGSAKGSNTTVNPIYNVGLPTKADLVINPFEIGTDAVQVSSSEVHMSNKSEVGVLVEMSVNTTLKAGVEFVAAKADVPNDVSDTTKAVNLLLVSAYDTESDSKYDFDATKEGTAFTFNGNSIDKAVILAAGTVTDAAKKTVEYEKIDGEAAFIFAGDVNPYGAWAAADITVDFTFKARAVTSTDATAFTALATTNAMNVIDIPAGFGPKTTIVLPLANATEAGTLKIPFGYPAGYDHEGEDGNTEVSLKFYSAATLLSTTLVDISEHFVATADGIELDAQEVEAVQTALAKFKGKPIFMTIDDAKTNLVYSITFVW